MMSSGSPFSGVISRGGEGEEGKKEIRLFGLASSGRLSQIILQRMRTAYGAESMTTLLKFFGERATVLGVHLYPHPDGSQWAQLWVKSEEEVERCLEVKPQLEASGITIGRGPTQISSFSSPPHPSQSNFFESQQDDPSLTYFHLNQDRASSFGRAMHSNVHPHEYQSQPPPVIRSNPNGRMVVPLRQDISGVGYRHLDPTGPLPRNLYVVDLPLDLTELQFRQLFENFGEVQHCRLMSQLDGMGRRRGFILMASHREALEATRRMSGQIVDGCRMDVSWALVQREASQFTNGHAPMSNHVIHPPTFSTRRVTSGTKAVLLQNLDSDQYSSAQLIRDAFSVFGPIIRVSILSSHVHEGLTVLIIYEQPISAEALVGQDGMMIGNRIIRAQLWNDGITLQVPQVPQFPYPIPHQLKSQSERPTTQRRFTFDPFAQNTFDKDFNGVTQGLSNISLKPDSSPFVPSSTTSTKSIPTFRSSSMITIKSPSPLQTLKLDSPQNQDATATPASRRPSPPESSRSDRSRRTSSEENKSGSGLSTSNNSASASISTGSAAKKSDKTDRTDKTKGSGSTDETQVSSQSVPDIPGKRFDRWLRAGMGGDERWFKSAAW